MSKSSFTKWLSVVLIALLITANVPFAALAGETGIRNAQTEEKAAGDSKSTVTVYHEVKFKLSELNTEDDRITLPKDQVVPEGTLVSELAIPSMPGMVFAGWYSDAQLTEAVGPDTAIMEDMTLYPLLPNGPRKTSKISAA